MNIQSPPQIRQAIAGDAESLAKLIDIAGEGIPNWLWSQSSDAQTSALAIGTERARRTAGGFSFTNALVATQNTKVAGMVLSYPITEAPEFNPGELPPPIEPFVELEKHSIGTWYINALAVFAQHRNQNIGSDLMRQAEQLAIASGYTAMSIQVYGQNAGAVKLYHRLGYRPVSSAAVQHHPCQPYYTGNVLLLVKQLQE